uniref:TIL domain-containing protein n=1 Tax=Hucho hucho TaxID=62062 RepID=A0A4W5PHI1_9TELE
MSTAFSCPANSHYQTCAEICATPCPGLSDTINCPTTCAEGCACDKDFYFNGTGCVSWDQCSCYAGGHTLKIGESLISDNCFAIHICQKSGVVLSQSMVCQSEESCQVKDGLWGCYPIPPLNAVVHG